MQENYIHIYTSFLSDLLTNKELTFTQTHDLLQSFAKHHQTIQDRQALIQFLDRYIFYYPQFKLLKDRLLDEAYKFPEPPPIEE
jgi:hypothetical protein